MIDVFMIFTMTVPLLEIVGHTYAEHLRLEISELDDLSDPPKIPLGLSSPPASVSIQPLGLDDPKLDIPQIKSELFANDKRSEFNFFCFILQDFDFDNMLKKNVNFFRTLLERRMERCAFFQDVLIPIVATGQKNQQHNIDLINPGF